MARHELTVHPGHKVTVNVSFSAVDENAISIEDFVTGEVIKQFDNRSNGGGSG